MHTFFVDAYNVSTTFSLATYTLGRFPVSEQNRASATALQQQAFHDAVAIYRLSQDDHDGLRMLQARAHNVLSDMRRLGLPPVSIDDYTTRLIPGIDQPTKKRDLIKRKTHDNDLCRQALLHDYCSVPDIYVDIMIERLRLTENLVQVPQDEQKAALKRACETNPKLYNTLRKLAQTKPERFSSDLSIMVYLGILGDVKTETSHSMLALLARRAASDVRAMPLLEAVLDKNMAIVSPAMLPKIFEAYARHHGSSSRRIDSLTDLFMQKRPNLAMDCARAIFTEEGAPLLRINQSKFFNGLSKTQRTEFISACYRDLTTGMKAGWKELAIVSAYQIAYYEKEGDVPEDISPWDNFHSRFATTDQNTLKDYATSLVFKILLSYCIRGDKTSAAIVYDYLRMNRRHHLTKVKSMLENGHLLSDGIPGASQAFRDNTLPTIYKLLIRGI
ncbi:MAG: hypothetical protein ABII18_12030 [bacterium]